MWDIRPHVVCGIYSQNFTLFPVLFTLSTPSAKPVVTNTTEKVSPAKTPPTATSVASFPTQTPTSSVTITTRMPNPKSSMTNLTTGRPPSPFALPPFQLKAQAETDPKKIQSETEQKTIDKPKGWLFGGTRKAASKGSEAKGNKYSSDSEDAGMRIITITGDNQGAFMEINQPSHHKIGFQGTLFRLENIYMHV
ncbi:hypothetical protein F3Y22_tig00112428pilonHSYRG00080 [Hibiscus syriacus]|uniref:Uncharacterized protein n=1 Tax=Hibiscus syriacus TaxID=106335 RepID=A0A6A2YA10_HIBSY|nr:hypothetical protein F3Y22_tig00112428pilonHSYRG00080 [Hibiscus syriacus]